MLRKEVLREWFFPIPSLRENGLIKPAPPEALKLYVDLKVSWLAQHQKLLHEVPAVSLSPGKRNEKDGYFVRTEILYKKMLFDKDKYSILSLDNFWLEHQGRIRQIRKTIEAPKTRVGEEILKDALNNTIFVVYNRLNPVLGSLIALIEYDEIFQAEGSRYLTDPQNQRMVLKALGIIIESEIKAGYLSGEKMKYEDYLPFLKGALLRLHQYEEQVQVGRGQSVNFVDSLIVIVSQEISKLKGVRNFGVGIEGIRRKIKDYLPALKKIEEGRIFTEIRDQITDTISSNVEAKKIPRAARTSEA